MHVIELRTAPQGHPSYRRVCRSMHEAIANVAGHHGIAGAMKFADHSVVELERLQSERWRRSGGRVSPPDPVAQYLRETSASQRRIRRKTAPFGDRSRAESRAAAVVRVDLDRSPFRSNACRDFPRSRHTAADVGNAQAAFQSSTMSGPAGIMSGLMIAIGPLALIAVGVERGHNSRTPSLLRRGRMTP